MEPKEQAYPNPQFQGGYPHPQPPPAYEPMMGSHTVAPPPLEQPTVVHVYHQPQVGPEPTTIVCPSCRQHIVTRLDYETTTKTHIMAGILCAFVCWPCAWIPYVMDSCKNANHYCPSCGAFIGTYSS